ncbi:MAG: hypothetical protein FWC27_00515, partial [Firmicutes bacterium]|nr:hypothetical protein [Bacillota bacterium]
VTPIVNGSGGVISPDQPVTVNAGSATQFTLSPATGFAIGSVDDKAGSCGGTLTGGTYTTNPINADCSVEVIFVPQNASAGLGNDQGEPEGTPLALPAGLSITGIRGAYDQCENATSRYGTGSYVNLCIELDNRTDGPVEFTFPIGLIFVSDSGETQNGLLLEKAAFTCPPRTEEERQLGENPCVIELHAYCLNLGRHATQDGDIYRIGPVTSNTRLLELLSLLAGKQITPTDWGSVQNVVWDITEDDGLTQADRDFINSLPAATSAQAESLKRSSASAAQSRRSKAELRAWAKARAR